MSVKQDPDVVNIIWSSSLFPEHPEWCYFGFWRSLPLTLIASLLLALRAKIPWDAMLDSPLEPDGSMAHVALGPVKCSMFIFFKYSL